MIDDVGEDPLDEEYGDTEQREGWAVPIALSALVCAGLVGVPFLLLKAWWTGFFHTPDAEDLATMHTLHGWAAVLALAVPAACAVIALRSGRRGTAWFFAAVLVVSGVIVLITQLTARPDPVPDRGPLGSQYCSGPSGPCSGR